ncbi:MAG: hypothetical protein HOD92_12205, partial [Deltaproteobacteria bacterium]|nr:hypothetical protein [Deltaproteobacteria bacterium]
MRKIRIVCVGKNQKSYVSDGLADFEKRMRRYCDFQTVFVKEVSYRSGSQIQWAALEGKSLKKHI